MRKVVTLTLMSLAMMLIACTPLHAALITYSDRTSFDAATGGGLSFESFETPFSGSASVSFTGFSITESGGANVIYSWDDTFLGGVGLSNASTDGTRVAGAQNQSASLFTFQFDNPINAFGLDITTDSAVSVDVGGDISSSFNTAANTAYFFGVVDNMGTFDTVTFDFGSNFLGEMGYDSVSFGTSVIPEPSSFLAWGGLLGLGLIGGYWRKRRRQ